MKTETVFLILVITKHDHDKETLSTHYYYLAMAEDIILRLLWVIGLILKQVPFIFGEMLRCP